MMVWLATGLGVAAAVAGVAGYLYCPRRRALRELQALRRAWREDAPPQWILARLSRLLRHHAMRVASDRPVAGLSGERWLLFLDRTGATTGFSQGPGRALLDAPYRHGTEVSRRAPDVDAILDLSERWLRQAGRGYRLC